MKKNKLAAKIVNFWVKRCTRKRKKSFSSQLEYEITGLNPGISSGKLVYEFYVNKISLCLVILGTGCIFIFLYVWSTWTDKTIEDSHYLERNPVGGLEKTVVLDAYVGELTIKGIEVPVAERVYSTTEEKALLLEISGVLPERILGENASLEHVDKPLDLPVFWENAPVSIFWDSSNYDVLQNDGRQGTGQIPETGTDVILTATINCGESCMQTDIPVKVYPAILSTEESIRQDLTFLVEQNQEKSKTKEYLELPVYWEEEAVEWKKPMGSMLPTLILLLVGTIVAVFVGKDREIHKEYEERNRQLLLEYPEFISKLQLLLGCGMSIRSAFSRMGSDYQKSRKKGGKKQYVSEELLLAVRKMENGMSEGEALEYFGARCHLFCYKKAVILILQNLKRGSDGLKEALLEEVKSAFEQRKQTAKKMGEEAGTKLLLPMMLMMGVVLIIIIVPAYFSFGGI